MTQTEPKVGPLQVQHPALNRGFLWHEPRAIRFVPDVHRTPHDPQRIVIVQRWYNVTRVQRDDIPLYTRLVQHIAKNAGMLAVDMLKNQQLL